MKNRSTQAFFAVIGAAILASTSGLFIKAVSIPASSIGFIRMAVPVVLLGAWIFFSGVPFFRGNYKMMLTGSVFNAIRMYFFLLAYQYTTIGNAVLISFTWPIFVTILSIIFLKEKVHPRNIFLLLCSFIGIVVVFSNKPLSFENRDFLGMSAALVNAFAYSISVLIFKKATLDYSRNEIIFYQNLVGFLVFLPFFFNNPFPNVAETGILIGYGILMGIIGFHLFFFALTHLKASTASMIAYIEIVSAMLLGYFVLGETVSLNMIIGGAIILVTTSLLRTKN